MTPKPLDIGPYIVAVVIGGTVEAVCLDKEIMKRPEAKERSLKRDLTNEVSGKFGRMHRCDFYTALAEGKKAELFLIEVTDLVQSVKRMKKDFEKDSPLSFERLEDKPFILDYSKTDQLLDEMHWKLIYGELCHEHIAKAQATMLVLEEMRQNKTDGRLARMLKYKKIHYILVLENNYAAPFMGEFLQKMRKGLCSTLVGEGHFQVMEDKNFDRNWKDYIARSNLQSEA